MINNSISKIGNGQVVENLSPKKMIVLFLKAKLSIFAWGIILMNELPQTIWNLCLDYFFQVLTYYNVSNFGSVKKFYRAKR